MTSLRLYKREKLCSGKAIDALFQRPGSAAAAIAYPLRVLWRRSDLRAEGTGAQFLIVVPKKRLRHAVDRVKMRRRVREAYRLSRHLLPEGSPAIDIAFVYVASELRPYADVERSVRRLLSRIASSLADDTPDAPRS